MKLMLANLNRQLAALEKQQAELDRKRQSVNESIGWFVRGLRVKHRKRLVHVAKSLGLCVSTVWSLENGRKDWTLDLFQQTLASIRANCGQSADTPADADNPHTA